jgi:hypothetical protein
MVAIGVHLIVDYSSRIARKKTAEERVVERRAVAEIRRLGGFTNYSPPPEFWVISVEFMATGRLVDGKAVIDAPKITDQGLVHIKALTRLQTLKLDHANVTDIGLEHLWGLTNLRSLTLTDTDVTDGGVEKLRRALPKCRIEH